MPLVSSTGSSLPLDEQLEEHKKYPNFTFGQTVRELGPESLLGNTAGLAYKHLTAPPLATETIQNPYGRGFRHRYLSAEEVEAKGDVLYQTEQQYKLSDAYDPDVPWEKGMTRSRAKVLGDYASSTRARQIYSEARPVSSFLIALGAGVADPVNFIPIFGTPAKLGLLGRAGIRAIEGGVSNLAVDIATMHARQRLNIHDMSADQIAQDMAIGALLGPILGAGFDVGHYFWGRAPKQVPPPAPKIEEPTAEVPAPSAPTPAAPATVTDRIGAEPYDLRQLKADLESEQSIILSRAVLNDGIYQYLNGDPIVTSPMSQSIINQSSATVAYQLEKNRYDFVEQKQTPAEMKEIAKADKDVVKAQKRVDKVRNQLKKEGIADPDDFFSKPSTEKISLKAYDLSDEFRSAKEELDNAKAKKGQIKGKKYGYTIEHNPVVNGFDYGRMNSADDLPVEITSRLPVEVKNKINLIIANAKRKGATGAMSPNIKYEIAPHMGELFSGTYGRMYHMTPTLFDQFDFTKTASNTEARSAAEGFYFARDPGTTTHPAYGRSDSIAYDPVSKIGTYDTMLEATQYFESPDKVIKNEFKAHPEIAEKFSELVKKANELEDKIARSDTKEQTKALMEERASLEKQWNKEFPEAVKDLDFGVRPHVRVQNIVLKNPYVYDWQAADNFEVEKRFPENHILAAKKAGNDGVIFLNAFEGGVNPGTAIVAFSPEQIQPGLQIPTQIKWTEPKVDVNWKAAESDIDKAAVQFSKPMEEVVKTEKSYELEGVDVTKTNGVGDPELDRINVEAAKMGMTESEIAEFDEQLKAIQEDMASDDRLAKASEAVIKCRNR